MYNNPDFFYLFIYLLFLDMHNIRDDVPLYGHLMYQSHRLRRLPGNLLLLEKICILQLVCKWLPAVSHKEGAAQKPHDYFGLADCSALVGSAAPDRCCNIDVAAGLKPRVYDCIGFYCHLKEILGQRLRDMQISRGRSCDSLQSVSPQVSCFQSLCL